MSTATPITAPTIPTPTDDPVSVHQSLMAIKQNIEIMQGTRGVVRASNIHGPTPTNIATNAALRRVQSTYP